MLVKIHKSYRTVVAICDEELIGKKFEQDNKQLDLTSNFFKGEEKTAEEVLDIIEKASYEDATFNIIGNKSTDLALKAGIIKPEGIQRIQEIPVALVLL
jgi:hypothetical protein